jgi:hypothetical protein
MKTHQRVHLPWDRGYSISGGEFISKTLTIGMGDFVDSIHGGAVFKNCELRIAKTARQSMNFQATFIETEVRPKQALRNKQMADTVFINCQFFGQYIGCEFGRKLEDDVGRIENCDFSAARLHLTEFFSCSLEELHLPAWPHIFLVSDNAARWHEQFESIQLPPNLVALGKLPWSDRVSQQSILAVHLPSFDIDHEQLWPLIQDMSHVWFPGKGQRTRANAAAVSTANETNSEATAALKRNKERSRIFHLLHRSWLKGVTRGAPSFVDLIFDTSFLQQRVPEAPAEVKVRLRDGNAFHRNSTGLHEITSSVDRFMVMGVAMEGDDIVLKPHRKERGQVKLTFSSYSVLSASDMPLEYAELLTFVERYLRLA